jgi:phosphoribosylanthranilate isomerase
MALKTKVLVGNITNLSDARYCAGMEVDFLGFSASKVDSKQLSEIREWVVGPSFFVELENINDYPAWGQQVGIILPVKKANWPETLPGEWIAKYSFVHNSPDELMSFRPTYVIGIDYHPTHRADLNALAQKHAVLIYIEDAARLDELKDLPIAGYYLEGGEELRPGLRDFTSLSEILELLEVAES